MMKRYIAIWSICLIGFSLPMSAQTQEQAKTLFNDGKYEEAKTAFEKLLKRNPRNGNLNYWYGVCCYKTGEKENSLKYLELAAERKVREANRYLALCHADLYQYEKAQTCWETYFDLMERAKKPIDEYQPIYQQTIVGKQLMRNIQDVIFIDSFVVEKKGFLKNYRLSKEAGSLSTYNQFFNEKTSTNGIVYRTEMGNKIFFSAARKDADSLTTLYTSDLIGNEWRGETELKGIEANGNINFPYMLSDGITFYYATDGEGSLGGYDIFVTRYDSEDDKFLMPENAGIPFNSPANDYMLAIDEYNNLGWFATDRRQPEGLVCIYVFIPDEEMKPLDTTNMTPQAVTHRASIHAIEDSWYDKSAVREGKQRLATSIYAAPEEEKKGDFEFFIDDLTTYTTLTDFKSPQARELFNQWKNEQKSHTILTDKLENKREQYVKSTKQQRQSMTTEILGLEKRIESLQKNIERLEKETRNKEILHLKK